MNILMISHYAGAPQYGMEYRSYYMGREWARMGHQVTIVGATFSHLRHHQPAAGCENIDGINYIWLPTRQYEGNGLGRVLSMFEFVAQVYRNKLQLEQTKPDVVIASSVYTFDLYPCRHIARRCKAKLVYEVHDLWPLSPMIIGGYSLWHPFIWLLQRGENYAYKHSDLVVSIPDKTFPHMERHGLDKSRFCCIPNGYLQEEWQQTDNTTLPQPHADLLAKLHSEGKTIVGFAGGHTQSTAMDILLKAAHILAERNDIAYVLVGQGPQKEELIQMAEQMQLTNVHFLPSLDKTLIPSLLQQFDICYAGGVHSILHQYGTSFNKITDYMMASRPIIFSVDEPGSLIERVGCGIQVEAEKPKQVAEAILQLASLSSKKRDAMGQLGHDYAQSHLNYTTLSKEFINRINKI